MHQCHSKATRYTVHSRVFCRASDEIGWNERVPSHSVPPPASTVEQFPDPVSMRLTFRRYHSEPAEWQVSQFLNLSFLR